MGVRSFARIVYGCSLDENQEPFPKIPHHLRDVDGLDWCHIGNPEVNNSRVASGVVVYFSDLAQKADMWDNPVEFDPFNLSHGDIDPDLKEEMVNVLEEVGVEDPDFRWYLVMEEV